MPSLKNSTYWKNQIEITQDQIAELLHSETFDLQSAKSDDDTIVYQGIEERLKTLRIYLAYCEKQYEETLKEETGESKYINSILFFERENGY